MTPNLLPTLRFLLLGPTDVIYEGVPFAVDRTQNRALLYRLAAQPTPVSREHLAFLFWPDKADDHSRRLLTQLLSHVRRALPNPELLKATQEHIQLDPTQVWSDVAAFSRLSHSVAVAPIEELCQMLALYRGPFLEGVSVPDHPEYDAWIVGERIWLERLYLDVLRRLFSHSIGQGQLREAIDLARRYLATDRMAEEIHRQLMECYAAVGERSAALLQYESCVRILEQELGVSPLPETNALYQRIRTGAMMA